MSTNENVSLKAAARKVCISPPNWQGAILHGYGYGSTRCTGKKDDVYARVLVLDANGSRALIVSTDTAFSNEEPFWPNPYKQEHVYVPAFVKGTREEWAHAAGCPQDNVFVSASHTHSAPGLSIDGRA